jgi:hypothetical protein
MGARKQKGHAATINGAGLEGENRRNAEKGNRQTFWRHTNKKARQRGKIEKRPIEIFSLYSNAHA